MNQPVNENTLWQKISDFAKQAGREVIEKVLWLYYAAQEPDTPAWAKSTIYGALAYFILPTDTIPDFIPVTGFTDDLSMLAAAVGTVSLYITAGVKEKAAERMAQWFD